MKHLGIFILILFLAGLTYAKTKTATYTYDDLNNDIAKSEKLREEKYEQILPTISPEGIEYTVHEYVSPDGPGYQLIIYDKNRAVKSYGVGPEAVERTFELPAPFINSTST